tara:strand:+ start:347 stop:1375 length:1029 start_codon:yes stop_codon:yes gene_type:complete
MKVLSAETNLGSATNVGKAPVVRIYNSDSSAVTLTRKDAAGIVIGTYSVPADKVIYCQKSFTDTLEGGANLKAAAIGYSEMLDIVTLASGAGGVITDNLMFHLDAGNAESYGDQTTLWKDLTTNNNDFQKQGAPTHDPDTNGGIFTFDGTDDAFFCPHNSTQLLTDKNFTFEIWVKAISLNSEPWTKILAKDRAVSSWTGTGVQSYAVMGWNNTYKPYSTLIQRENGTSGASEMVADDANFPTGVWKHMVVTADFNTSISDGFKLYMNNVLEDTGDISDFSGASGEMNQTGDFTIGNRKQASSWSSTYANISASIVRVYVDKALTASEVAQHWNHEKARHGL